MQRARPRLDFRSTARWAALAVPLGVALIVLTGMSEPRHWRLIAMLMSFLVIAPYGNLYLNSKWYPDLFGVDREIGFLQLAAVGSPWLWQLLGASGPAILALSVVVTAAATLMLERIRRAVGEPPGLPPRPGRPARRAWRAVRRAGRPRRHESRPRRAFLPWGRSQ